MFDPCPAPQGDEGKRGPSHSQTTVFLLLPAPKELRPKLMRHVFQSEGEREPPGQEPGGPGTMHTKEQNALCAHAVGAAFQGAPGRW